MREKIRDFFAQILGVMTRRIIKKYAPRIVAITGSVGKTSTKVACAAVLGTKFHVRSAAKNYNNVLGLPLAILGLDAPGLNPFKWLANFYEAVRLLCTRDPRFPRVFILEFGADHPGDITYLCSIAPPDVSVITAISAAHTEFFGSVEGVRAEKKIIATGLASTGTAILNRDDALVDSIANETRARVVTFGFGGGQIKCTRTQVHYNADGTPSGTEIGVQTDGGEVGMFVPGVLGRPVAYAALAAVAVGQVFDMTIEEISRGLAAAQFPPGRMRIISGIKQTTIIDDTYNASSRAMTEAVRALVELHADHHRIAVLGDMLELGALTEDEHRKIGLLVATSPVDLLVTVGAASRFIGTAAVEGGMDEAHVLHFDSSDSAGRFLQDKIEQGDVILVKGSQGVRCEKTVKEIMAEPARAGQLLVRQDKKWLV